MNTHTYTHPCTHTRVHAHLQIQARQTQTKMIRLKCLSSYFPWIQQNSFRLVTTAPSPPPTKDRQQEASEERSPEQRFTTGCWSPTGSLWRCLEASFRTAPSHKRMTPTKISALQRLKNPGPRALWPRGRSQDSGGSDCPVFQISYS